MPLIKVRYTICNSHGAYVIDLFNGKITYGQGAVEPLLTGHAWADAATAYGRLQEARQIAPSIPLRLARVEYEASPADPTRWRAVNSKMLPVE